MYEINTIQDFQALSFDLQAEIQKAIRAKDRLEAFLPTINKRAGQLIKPAHEAHWETCTKCKGAGQVFVDQSRDDRDIHPSQIHKCLKFLWLSCAGYVASLEENVDPRLRMIFDLGTVWGDQLQRYGRMGAWCAPEHYHREAPIDPDAKTHDGHPVLPLAEYYRIRGHADALITRYEMPAVPRIGDVAIRLVHEYKTINSGNYSKLTRPKPEHKFQATMYSAVFNVPIVVYMYTNKDNCNIADFPVPFDNTIWSEVTQKIDKVLNYVDDNIVPPWEETAATKNPSECMDCGYVKACQPPITQLKKRTA